MRLRRKLAGLFAVAIVAAASAAVATRATAHADPPPPQASPAPLDASALPDARRLGSAFVQVADRVSPSVVSIRVARPGDPRRMAFPFPFGPMGPGAEAPIQRGMGSGIIIDAQGHIVTNNHVVERATELEVKLRDGRVVPARLVGTDEAADVAVIKIDAPNLVPARLGSAERMRVGEWVVAIGSPFGLETTVTVGVLSAKGRAGIGMNNVEDYLQTDASINPGNSGGPLVNLDGEVIGINTMIVGQGTGIGFAIPTELARESARQLIASGRVHRAWIGVGIQDLTPELAGNFAVQPGSGALLSQVVPGAPAARAGLSVGDVVLSIGGTRVRGSQEAVRAVLAHRPGERVDLRVLRGGREQTIAVTVGERPSEDSAVAGVPAPPAGDARPTLGLQLGVAPDGRAIVAGVLPGSLADRAGLQPGDIIAEIDRHAVRTAQQAAARLAGRASALLRIERGGQSLYVPLS